VVDHIEPLSFVIALTTILAGLLALGIRDRIYRP
jgi:hypothetical protein